jgi:uncharacterized protein (DUF302 family)
MTSSLGFEVRLAEPFDSAVQRVRDALQAEGFGVLTTIDLRAAFREKLDKDFRPYVILGACNPPLAHRALTASGEVGLLLPCNVTVEATPEGASLVRMIDPDAMLGIGALAGHPDIRDVAVDARARFERVAKALAAGPAA